MRRQYVGFTGGPTGYTARELDVRSPVSPSTEASIAFPIAWEKRSDIERAVRNFKQNGLPIVRLWGSGRSSLALGVNPKRVPRDLLHADDPELDCTNAGYSDKKI